MGRRHRGRAYVRVEDSGVHTVFAAIMGTLGGAAGVAAAVAAVQFVLYRKKKRAERRELARLNGEEEAA